MTVFKYPPQAQSERTCFSVLDFKMQEELMIVPDGAEFTEAFEGLLWFENTERLSSLPISEKTLVPEAMAAHFPENPVFVSSKITDGTLLQKLTDAQSKYGKRLWLLIEPYCHRYPLPNRSGVLLAQTPPVPTGPFFYSQEFCCNYRVYPERSELFLFDTEKTLQKKQELADELAIPNVFILP